MHCSALPCHSLDRRFMDISMHSDNQRPNRDPKRGPRFVRWRASFAMIAGIAAFVCPVARAQDPLPIKEILLVHFAHTDFGYTDQPEVVRELHRHYVDIAL